MAVYTSSGGAQGSTHAGREAQGNTQVGREGQGNTQMGMEVHKLEGNPRAVYKMVRSTGQYTS